jgi:hypothetical protein
MESEKLKKQIYNFDKEPEKECRVALTCMVLIQATCSAYVDDFQ